MSLNQSALQRAESFCREYDLTIPVLMAPMAGACPASLAIAVGSAGGMGACGALLMDGDAIAKWAGDVRSQTNGAFQMNLWIPDPEPVRDEAHEAQVRAFLGQWGPQVAPDAGEPDLIDFDAQCEAILAAGPSVISSIMGLYPAPFVARMKERNIRWFATVTTVEEALAAQAAGADAVVAQGMEAGGHRGAFNAEDAASKMVGLFSLLPAVVDAVKIPVIATGGIADARGVAAALMLGASSVQIGTGLLRTPEAKTNPAWANAIADARPEGTIGTRAFSARLGRSIRSDYAIAANSQEAPSPAPYPIQRGLTAAMRAQAASEGDITKMQAWAGQSAALAKADPAGEVVTKIWAEAKAALG